MMMEERELDYLLVPFGIAIFVSYHAWLLTIIIRNPRRTVIGINSESRHHWVLSIMTVSLHFLLFSFYILCFNFNYFSRWIRGIRLYRCVFCPKYWWNYVVKRVSLWFSGKGFFTFDAVAVLDSSKICYFWLIRHALVDIFEELDKTNHPCILLCC